MTPEEIVARAICDHINTSADPADDAAAILAALREAGYRIVRQRPYNLDESYVLRPDGMHLRRVQTWVDVKDGAQ